MRSKLILIGGGTASGKTTIANKIKEIISDVLIISIDNYYNSNWGIPLEERRSMNYDHPSSIEWPLLKKHLADLMNGKEVEMPQYDFKLHQRKKEAKTVRPSKVIVLDGIFALYDEEIRNMSDIKIYVDTPADIRFIRRLLRDINERGRTLDSVIHQYIETVRPMHERFIKPTKRYADIIVPFGINDVIIDILKAKIEKYVKEKS